MKSKRPFFISACVLMLLLSLLLSITRVRVQASPPDYSSVSWQYPDDGKALEHFRIYSPYSENRKTNTVYDRSGVELLQIPMPESIKPWPEYSLLGKYWIYFLIGIIAVVLGVLIAFITRKVVTKPRIPVSPPPSLTAMAKLILPSNIEISLSDGIRSIGRGDLVRAVSADDLGYISRQHFEVGFANGQYYIEDLNSLNGTKLNGVEIKSEGKHTLKDGDKIEVAAVVALIFKIA